MTIDEAIAREREFAKDKRKEMKCKTCKLFERSVLHPLQGYCRKNKFHSIEIDSWRKVCREYVPKEMCKCAEEHEQLAEWLEELKEMRKNQGQVADFWYQEGISKSSKLIFDKIEEIKNRYDNEDFAIIGILIKIQEIALETAEQLKAGGENDNLRR